jgi:hypothetical protein
VRERGTAIFSTQKEKRIDRINPEVKENFSSNRKIQYTVGWDDFGLFFTFSTKDLLHTFQKCRK